MNFTSLFLVPPKNLILPAYIRVAALTIAIGVALDHLPAPPRSTGHGLHARHQLAGVLEGQSSSLIVAIGVTIWHPYHRHIYHFPND